MSLRSFNLKQFENALDSSNIVKTNLEKRLKSYIESKPIGFDIKLAQASLRYHAEKLA